MSFFEKSPINSANGLPSQSQVTQQQQFPIESRLQSNSHFPQQNQQSQPINPWSAHNPLLGQSSSSISFLRYDHVLSTTATAAGELFLFGGYVCSSESASNDLYMISTRDFSATLLNTSGDVPDPRFGHRVALAGTTLLIWGGWVTSMTRMRRKKYGLDDSLYLLNLASRNWARVAVNGPRPCNRCYHTVTLIGSKLFVFGGWDYDTARVFNDIWAFDLNFYSNPRWESYETAPGNEKPLPRAGHVSVTTDDCIIIFGGRGEREHFFNDTWSFDISTRKWTEIRCTGPIPSLRIGHAAVLVDNVMYVFGGRDPDGTRLGDLTAFDLSTQRWTAFRDIGSGPCGRSGHAMASDGTRIFLLGGMLSTDAEANESELLYVLDTKRITYPDPDPNAVDSGENATQLVRESSAGPSTQGQPQQSTFSSSDSNVHAERGTSAFLEATRGELDHPTSLAALQIALERIGGSIDLPLLLPGMDDKPRHVEKDDDNECSTERHAKFVAPDASSEKEVPRSEPERIADLERQLSEMLAAQTERDRRNAWLTDELAQKSALLKQAEAKAAEAKKRARPEQREQAEALANLNKLLLSRDEALEQAQQAQGALKEATSRAAEANERSRRELAEVHAKLEARESELAAVRLRLTDAENGWAKSKAKADRLQTGTVASLVDLNEDRFLCEDMEDIRVMGAELTSLKSVKRKRNEKSIEEMERGNEG